MGKLNGKTVFITGASSGIGESCARIFATEGARLLLAARRLHLLEQLTPELLKAGASEVHVFELDVCHRAKVEQSITELPSDWQKIDVLINNAGLSRGLDKLQEG